MYVYSVYAEIKKNLSREHSVITARVRTCNRIVYASQTAPHMTPLVFMFLFLLFVAPAAYSSSSTDTGDVWYDGGTVASSLGREVIIVRYTYQQRRAHARFSFWTCARPMGLRGVRSRCVNRYSVCKQYSPNRRPRTGSTLVDCTGRCS